MPVKPKPPRLHSIDGGRSKQAKPKFQQPPSEDLVRPDDLPESAVPEWDKITALLKGRIATLKLDSLAVADLAVCMARLKTAEAKIEADGMFIKGAKGVRKHPAMQAAREYRDSVRRWFACFGMDPSDRLKLGVSTPELSPEEQLEALISS